MEGSDIESEAKSEAYANLKNKVSNYMDKLKIYQSSQKK